MKNRVRVLIVNRHSIVRKGLAQIVEECDQTDLIGVTDISRRGQSMAIEKRPDVVIFGVTPPTDETYKLMGSIVTGEHPAAVLAFGLELNRDAVLEAIGHGVSGFLSVEADHERILECVLRCAEGEKGLFDQRTATEYLLKNAVADETDLLSQRQSEVLKLVAQGSTNREVAETLFLSQHTIKNHLTHIYRKLDVHSRVEAISWAWRNGMLEREANSSN
jgi:DNA-binding NarL/FixJ family response regulator